LGLEQALPIFSEIRETLKVPVLTDVHEPAQCAEAAKAVDILQIPAFLCRQTDLLVAAARTSRAVNVKKGQFLAPWDMQNVVAKITGAGNRNVLVTERGASFGYNTLVRSAWRAFSSKLTKIRIALLPTVRICCR
jgi:2-dehydro-3-deoxyphosphooctonate aldolase (KDO 8-P synthase)